jgi:uncharacterized damage-inducible protein DinB
MSGTLDSYIKNWNRIHKQTTNIMGVAPDDKYDWKPSETSMTLGALMNHFRASEAALIIAAIDGKFPEEFAEPITSTEELVKAFDKSHEEMVAKVSALTPEFLAGEVTPFGPDRKMSRMVVLKALHEHEIHHRGQLYVYLRILGCEVPPLFA